MRQYDCDCFGDQQIYSTEGTGNRNKNKSSKTYLKIVELHVVNQGGKDSAKEPLANAQVKVFDRDEVSFQSVAGSKNPKAESYGQIFETNVGKVGGCITDIQGICLAGEEAIGNYLVIVKYTDDSTNKTVYTGLPKGPEDFVNNVDGMSSERQTKK